MKTALVLFFCLTASLAGQELALEELQALLDYDRSDPTEAIYRVESSDSEIVVADYSFTGPAGDRVMGTLASPRSDGPTPLILFGHWMMPGSALANRQEFLEEAKLVARAGATCLLLDGPLIRPGVVVDPEPMNGQGPLAQVQMAKEWRVAIDLMLSGQNVDPERIAYVGHSFSAGVGAMLAGMEKRIGSFVLMANQYSLREYLFDDDNMIAVAQRKEVGDAQGSLPRKVSLERYGSVRQTFITSRRVLAVRSQG